MRLVVRACAKTSTLHPSRQSSSLGGLAGALPETAVTALPVNILNSRRVPRAGVGGLASGDRDNRGFGAEPQPPALCAWARDIQARLLLSHLSGEVLRCFLPLPSGNGEAVLGSVE